MKHVFFIVPKHKKGNTNLFFIKEFLKMSRIPDDTVNELFSEWKELTDQSYELFGVECSVFYPKKVSVSSPSSNQNTFPLNSINGKRTTGAPASYQNQILNDIQVQECITVKLYWNPREWTKIFGLTIIPEGSIVVLCKMEDAIKINNAEKIQYNDQTNTHTFSRTGKVIPWGFKKRDYGYCIWKIES